jgi:hypothetical protein
MTTNKEDDELRVSRFINFMDFIGITCEYEDEVRKGGPALLSEKDYEKLLHLLRDKDVE